MGSLGSLISRILEWWRNWIRWLIDWIRSHSGGGGTIEDDKCCGLARRDNECNYFGDKSNFSCPEGFNRQWWHCCEGTTIIGCGECTRYATSCWNGPYTCSIWWWTTQKC
jgi:hypothetical protein